MYLTFIVSFGVASRAAIWFIKSDVRAAGKLSNMLISPSLHPMSAFYSYADRQDST